MNKDYYTILGVEKNATKVEIKKAFHKLAHRHHPDKKGGDDAKFKEVSEAYSVLSDDKKRSEYDAYGKVFGGSGAGTGRGDANAGWGGFSGFGQQAQGFDFDLGDIFGNIFGGGERQVRRGNDISIDIEISFADSIFGVERKVLITKNSACDECNGSGAKKGTEMETCSACNGNGKIYETKRSFLGAFSSVRMCDKCYGKGKTPKEKCKVCRGTGVVRKQETIVIQIPVGINNGEMIRLVGAGEAISRGVTGDLYVKIHITPHPDFKKEGINLIINLGVKLSDALLGAEYTVETLDGKIKVKIPKGVTHGEMLRIKNKGVPVNEQRRGDLLIKLNIKLPTKLSRKAKTIVEELRKEGI
ncbi:MAG: J domain-containing protein [Patescibacteria group bacterium]